MIFGFSENTKTLVGPDVSNLAFFKISETILEGLEHWNWLETRRNGFRTRFLASKPFRKHQNLFMLVKNHSNFLEKCEIWNVWPHQCFSIFRKSKNHLARKCSPSSGDWILLFGLVLYQVSTYIWRRKRTTDIFWIFSIPKTIVLSFFNEFF
jgi:hypothetical protein